MEGNQLTQLMPQLETRPALGRAGIRVLEQLHQLLGCFVHVISLCKKKNKVSISVTKKGERESPLGGSRPTPHAIRGTPMELKVVEHPRGMSPGDHTQNRAA